MYIRIEIEPLQYQSEALFMQSFKAGDNKAFEWIYTYLKKPLTLSALAIVGSVADAEDIVGNAFLKLYTHGRKELTSLEHIQRWISVVVRNESINFHRRKSIQKKAHLFLAEHAGTQEEGIWDKNIEILLEQAVRTLQALSGRRHVVLWLCFFENKTTRQIAEMLRISDQTVLNHKTKGIHLLRRRMAVDPKRQ